MAQRHDRFQAVLDTGLASRRVEMLLVLVVWLLFLILALRAFGPDSVYTVFNSDVAIPVLMANDDRPITVFDTYYYAADRWGGWPMLLAKWLHLNVGIHWTDQRLHYVRTTWLFFGLLFLAALNARARPAVIVSALIVLCLEPNIRRRMFDLSQLYAWQLPALFIAWFYLRRLLTQASVRVHQLFWSAAFFVSALFAIWSSIASVPFLGVLVTLEAVRSRFLFQKAVTNRRIGLVVVLLLAATACEFLMKRNYHRHSLKHFGFDFKTTMALDSGYLYENLLTNWHTVVQYLFFPFILIALSFVAGAAGRILYTRVAGKGALRTRLIAFFEDETATMIVVLTAMAAVNFVIMIFVSHVRTSGYDDRFHTPTYFFGAIGGLLSIYLAIRIFANRFAASRYVLPLILAGAFIFLVVTFPPRAPNETYRVYRETALALSQKTPGAILMGGYWQTYLFSGLQPTNRMTPLPFEGTLNRMPWTTADLKDSQQVVIEYRDSGLMPEGSSPPNELVQYGDSLKLQDARFYENGPYAFALYSKP